MKNAWEAKKSVETNLTEMGLSYDPNKTIKIPNTKRKFKVSLMSNEDEWKEEVVGQLTIDSQSNEKLQVANLLEVDAKSPRERKIRLPKGHIEWYGYLMKTYKNNYKAMAKDKKNCNQETWKQIRQKIRRFKSIPEQFNTFLQQNGLEVSEFNSDVDSDGEL